MGLTFLPAMDPISSSLHPASDSSDSDVESGGEPPSSEGLASMSESRYASAMDCSVCKSYNA